jgi:hypothetical protein
MDPQVKPGGNMDFSLAGATSRSGGLGRPLSHVEFCRHRISYFVDRRKDSKKSEWSSAQHLLVVDEYLEFTVVPAFQLDLLSELLPDLGGRTGRLNAGDSIRATSDSD